MELPKLLKPKKKKLDIQGGKSSEDDIYFVPPVSSELCLRKMKECRTQVLVYQNNSGVGDQIRLIFVETNVQQSVNVTCQIVVYIPST